MKKTSINPKNVSIKIFLALVMLGLLIAHTLVSAEPQQAKNTPQQEATASTASQEALQLSRQVVALYNEHKLNEALPLAKQALQLLEKEFGREHPEIVGALTNLALIYMEQREFLKAEPLYQRVLKIYEKNYGPDDLKVTVTLINLGWVRYVLGANTEAEHLFRRAVSINEKVLGPEHKETAVPLYNLARFYQKQGKVSQAVPYFERVLAIKEKRLGPKDSEVAEALEQCACALEQNKQFPRAKEMWARADKIRYGEQPDTQLAPPSVVQGKAISKPQPSYPRAARNLLISGAVLVRILIDESGQVTEATLLCGPDLLAPEALAAARQWRFSPTLADGKPMKVVGTLTFTFVLRP